MSARVIAVVILEWTTFVVTIALMALVVARGAGLFNEKFRERLPTSRSMSIIFWSLVALAVVAHHTAGNARERMCKEGPAYDVTSLSAHGFTCPREATYDTPQPTHQTP